MTLRGALGSRLTRSIGIQGDRGAQENRISQHNFPDLEFC